MDRDRQRISRPPWPGEGNKNGRQTSCPIPSPDLHAYCLVDDRIPLLSSRGRRGKG